MTDEYRCEKRTFRYTWIVLFMLACLWAVIVKPSNVYAEPFHATAEQLEGTAYAVLTSSGELIFFRSNNTYTAGTGKTVTDIKGNTYTGRVYTGIETTNTASTSNSKWYSQRTSIKSVRIADGQAIKPVNTAYWFYNCNNWNLKTMDLSRLDTGNMANMSYMFYNCSKLTSLDLSGFDTGNVTNMSYMFNNCSKLTSLDVSGFDTSNVTDMGGMFSNCSGLTNLDVSGFDTSNVTSMRSMFSDCSSLTNLDVSGFDTSKVTRMDYMFLNCSSLTSLDVSGFDTSNMTSMGGMFSNCSSLTSLDVSGLDTSNVTNMNQMFYDCSNLTNLDVSGFDTSNVTDMGGMFSNCSGLTNLDVSGFDTSNVTSMRSMFSDCSSLTNLDVSGFDTSKVTRMDYMFLNCSSLTSLDVSGFDTSNVTDMGGMFSNCSGLTNLDVSGFDTSNVTSMRSMFSDCSSLTNLDVSGFDTSKVTRMDYMFLNCSSLTSLDVSGFDTSNVTNMGSMFFGCTKLECLDLSNFDTQNVSIGDEYDLPGMINLFERYPKLKKVILGENFKFEGSGITNIYEKALLPTPKGAAYTGKWIQEEGLVEEPKTAEWLRDNYDGSTMAGTWMWEVNDTHGVVLFDANGGFTSEAKIEADSEGNEITIPDATNTTRPHYALSGWNDKADGTGSSYTIGQTYNDIVKFGKTVTLYAQWEPSNLREYKVKYYKQNRKKTGYNLIETEKDAANYGEPMTLYATKDYPGYIKPQASQTEVIKEDDSTVFSFYYDIRTYNVHFEPNPDSADAEITGETADIVLMGDESQKIDNRFGYKKRALMGWNTKADGTGAGCNTGEYLSVKKLVELFGPFSEEDPQNVTLYAQWMSNEDKKLKPTEGEVQVQGQADETLVIPDLPAGTKYTIRETDLPAGWHYNGDNIAGEIQANETSEVEITNDYYAEGSVQLVAHKQLLDGELQKDQFSFSLYDGNNINEEQITRSYIEQNCPQIFTSTNDEIDTNKKTTNDKEEQIDNPWFGTAPVYFEELTFNTENMQIGETYTYYILENNTGEPFVEYDNHFETVNITVKDAGHGLLDFDVTYDDDEALFTNKKMPEINKNKTGQLTVEKEVQGYNTNQMFDFNVHFADKKGVEINDGYSYLVVNTKDKDNYKNIVDGTVYAYSYSQNINQNGEKIEEVGPNWVFDSIRGTGRTSGETGAHVVTIPDAQTLHVRIKCSLGEGSDADVIAVWPGAHPEYNYDNSFDHVDDCLFDPFEGPSPSSEENIGEYDIEGNSVTFGYASAPAEYGIPNYGYYAVITAGGKTVEYDESKILRRGTTSSGETLQLAANETAIFEEMPVDLVYNIEEAEKPGYELTQSSGASGSIREDKTSSASFTNVYHASEQVVLQAQKHLTGGTLTGDDFSFTLYDENDEVLQTKGNTADGSVTFDPITYTQDDVGKTFVYYIKENTGNDEGIIYDQHPVQVKVNVQDNGDGTLSAVPEYQDSTTFTNAALSSITVSKQVSGNMASRDKQFRFTLSLEGPYYDHVITYTKTTASGTTTGTVYDPETQSGNPEPTLTYNFTLSHGDSITFDGIVRGAEYDVAETDSNRDSYTTTAQSSQAEIETISHIVHAKGTLTDAVTTAYTNNRGATVPTTAQNAMKFLLPALMIAGATIALVLYRKRKTTEK